ncbi:hypothetical protein HON71_01805 [Candidatus Woesearchaeota archaeon]|nr:hypothetical protein [Candidatus Woesearchaeota archaeon]MBT5342500.1 hypothetical protein [Candidatus Woesearchaeota archaeon]
MGIILMIVIIALIFILKLMFTPPKKITQKQHEKKYKNAYYVFLGIGILLILKLVYTLIESFSIWKVLDDFITILFVGFFIYYFKKTSKEKIKLRKITKEMKYNPASKTYFKSIKGKIQHYSEDLYKCKSCNKSYHPKVSSGSNAAHLVGTLIALVIVIVPFVVAIILENIWLFFGFGIVLVTFMLIYVPYYIFIKKRKVVKRTAKKIRYGEIILDCPKCGSTKAVKKKVTKRRKK